MQVTFAQGLLDWMNSLPEIGIYFILYVSSILENVFPPWPGDTVTVLGGVVMAHGLVGPIECMLVLITGNLTGAFIMYYAGAKILSVAREFHLKMVRPVFVKNFLIEFTSEHAMEKTKIWFERKGIYFILISRFSAGIRFFVSIVAGISRMNIFVFSVFFTLGVIVWNTLLLYGGFLLAKEWSKIIEWLKLYNVFVVFAIALIAGVILIYKFIVKFKTKRDDL